MGVPWLREVDLCYWSPHSLPHPGPTLLLDRRGYMAEMGALVSELGASQGILRLANLNVRTTLRGVSRRHPVTMRSPVTQSRGPQVKRSPRLLSIVTPTPALLPPSPLSLGCLAHLGGPVLLLPPLRAGAALSHPQPHPPHRQRRRRGRQQGRGHGRGRARAGALTQDPLGWGLGHSDQADGRAGLVGRSHTCCAGLQAPCSLVRTARC